MGSRCTFHAVLPVLSGRVLHLQKELVLEGDEMVVLVLSLFRNLVSVVPFQTKREKLY
jgi:hypothetical protein